MLIKITFILFLFFLSWYGGASKHKFCYQNNGIEIVAQWRGEFIWPRGWKGWDQD